MKFELCTDSLEGAELAGQYGFTTIELCAALSVGGLTPNFGLIKLCAERSVARVQVMIRHKEGCFQATENDIKIMATDIKGAQKAGADGVVFGILNDQNELDDANKELVILAHDLGLRTTFHRAFDFVPDFKAAMRKVEAFGFDRLLTSGLQPTAEEGIDVIAQIEELYGGSIEIIAGSGIHSGNALDFFNAGIRHLHFTARKASSDALKMDMGQTMVTDIDKIQAILNLPFD